jgi:putative heme-binding domain-containing protein
MERLRVLDYEVLAAAADDDEREVRVQAMRVLSERKDLTNKEHALLLTGLKDKDKDPFVQRYAADALGRHSDVENLSPLLALRQGVPAADTHLLHTVRMAIRDTLRLPAAWKELAKLSENDQKAIGDVAPGVPTAESAAYLVNHLQKLGGDLQQLLTLIHHIARYGDPGTSRQLLAFTRAHQPDQLGKQAALFQSVEQGVQERGAALDADTLGWGRELTDKLLASSDGGEIRTGIRIAGILRLKDTQAKLTAIAGEKSPPEYLRVEAVKSLAIVDEKKHVALFGRILADAAEPVALREETAHALARLNHEDALAQLVQALPLVPARLQTIIAADLAGTQAGGEKLLETVAAGKASARLLQERFVEVRLAGAKIPNLKERLAKLTEGLPPADQRMQELFKKRKAGFSVAKTDAALGAKVFEKNCANCHQLAGKGAKIGPQLDGIGIRGVDRLLEDILDPNRNVDQAFRATTLGLKDGQTLTGLLLREEGEILVLADAQGKEVRVPKNNVDERSTSQLSPMPANLVDQIVEQDFYHLLAFLLEQRAPKDGK